MYNSYITRIKNLRTHSNADRLLCGECFGNTVIVSLEYVDNQLGIYFPTDGQLSQAYAEQNNLLRKKDAEGNNIGGYLDPDKRNIKALKLRGEKSDGLFMPLESLASFGDISTLKEGDIVSVFNGVEIARKYIPHGKRTYSQAGPKKKKIKINIAPLFEEHVDTEQLAYNLSAFKCGDLIEITLKAHGSSQRSAHLPVFKKFKRNIFDIIFRKQGVPIYEFGYVNGTRRVVLKDYESGFYGSDKFREPHAKLFENKLNKGETVYYEVVGYVDVDKPIMANCSNKKTNDKEFIKTYGDTTTFSYGCNPGESKAYVYRMTMTNEDGYVVEYSPDLMRKRCEQIGVECVPVLDRFFIPDGVNAGEFVKDIAEKYYDGPDPIGKTHIREGVVVRIVNREKFTAFKIKNFNFKLIEGIIKESADTPDIEEAQEILEESNEQDRTEAIG